MVATHKITPTMWKERASLYHVPTNNRGSTFGKLKEGTLVEVTREWVNSKWNEIRIVDPNEPAFQKAGIKDKFFFVKEVDLTPLTDIDIAMYGDDVETTVPNILEKVYVKPQVMSQLEKVAIPNWVTNIGVPYYHREDAEYWMSVKLPFTSCVSQNMPEIIQQAKLRAVETLFDYYNIDHDAGSFVNGFLSCFMHDYHLDDRPGSKLKVLVKVRANYFDRLRSDPTKALRSSNIEDYPNVASVVVLDPEKYEKDVDKMAKVMSKYALDLQRDNVFVPGVNLIKEARRMKQFVARIKTFLIANGVDPDNRTGQKYNIEIGFDEGKNIVYTALLYDKKTITRNGYRG